MVTTKFVETEKKCAFYSVDLCQMEVTDVKKDF